MFFSRWLTSLGLIVLQLMPLRAFCNRIISQCDTLEALLPDAVSFPSSSIYNASIQSYFYVQERLEPDCIVTPTSSKEVSVIIKALGNIHSKTPQLSLFAVRGGGHAQVTGASNDNHGVTIDLRSINSLSLNSDKTVASIGGGAIWNDIYEQLDPLNLTVLGGRVAGVGVGGLLIGGELEVLKLLICIKNS